MRRILYLVHSLPPAEHTGTPLSAYGYARTLAARGWDVTVVYASLSVASWSDIAWRRLPDELFGRVEVPPSRRDPGTRDPSWAIEAPSTPRGDWQPATAAFGRILRRTKPDVVHVVNNVHLPLDWPELASESGVPVVRSVTCAEDLCGLIIPVSPLAGSAGPCLPPLTSEHCARCIESQIPEYVVTLSRPEDTRGSNGHHELVDLLRRKRARAVYQYQRVFDRVIFPSTGFRRYVEATIPLDPTRTRVIEMGMHLEPWAKPARTHAQGRMRGDQQPVVFCLAGTLNRVKGTAAVVDAFSSAELLDRSDYRLWFLGGGDEALVRPLTALNPHAELGGHYRPEDLPRLLEGADVGLAPSQFETFHRATREYLLAGLPVIGSHAFGIPDIVRHLGNGLLFDLAAPGALASAVTSVLDDRSLLARITEGARTTLVRSVEDEVDELVTQYEQVLGETRAVST